MNRFVTYLAVGAIALTGLLTLTPSWAAQVDYFLKIEGIKGESVEPKHKDWINLLSVSGNLSREASSGMATGKRQHKPFVVTKPVDKASPLLQEAATSGKVFPKVEIDVPAAEYGGSRGTYLKFELEKVRITSYSVSGDGSAAGAADTVPMETFSLNYEKITSIGPEASENRMKGDFSRDKK